MTQHTVLVGFAEASAAPEVVWSLVDAGFRVVAFARKGRSSALRHSRYVECHDICPPEVDLQASLSDLNSLLSSTDYVVDSVPQILFPMDDKAVWLTSKASLNDHWLLAGPRGPQAELALNKCVQIRFAQEAGFNVPKTGMARSVAEVFEFVATQPFPIILKAAECVPVWQGHLYTCRKWICSNRGELERALAEWGERVPLLLQSFVTGTGEGVFGVATSDGVRAWSAHRRVRMMNPQGSGSSACVSQTVPDDLKRKVETMLERSGWRGLFMVELLRDSSGELWFGRTQWPAVGKHFACAPAGLGVPGLARAASPRSQFASGDRRVLRGGYCLSQRWQGIPALAVCASRPAIKGAECMAVFLENGARRGPAPPWRHLL